MNIALNRINEIIVKDNPAFWSRKLDDTLWAFGIPYKKHTGTIPYKLIYGKNCHLPFEIEHRAYWPLKNFNPDMTAAGEKRIGHIWITILQGPVCMVFNFEGDTSSDHSFKTYLEERSNLDYNSSRASMHGVQFRRFVKSANHGSIPVLFSIRLFPGKLSSASLSSLYLSFSIRDKWTMDMTIDQQVALDKALVPHASRLRIGKSNFRLKSFISSKESTLQLVYDVLRLTPFYKTFIVTSDDLEIYMQEFWATAMTKERVRKTKSSFDTMVTPLTAAAGTRLSTSTKGKQLVKASKAKSLTVLYEVAMTEAEQLKIATTRSLQQTHISQASGSSADEGTGIIPGVLDVPTQESDEEGEEFIHPKLSIHDEEETKDEESFDPITKMPENSDDNGNDEENLGIDSIFETTSQMDVPAPTTVAPLTLSAPTLTPSTIATISTTLEANFSEFMQTNQFSGAVSSILEIVQRYMDQRMNEAVKVAVQIQSDRLSDEAQAENEEFLKNLDENIQKIIKEKTSYAVAADLSEMELKKILIEKMEGNKSIHLSDEQRNLYKALVEAYESNKIILDTYRDVVTLKRRLDDDADKDEEPFAGLNRGSKRRREGKEPYESAPAEEPMQTTHDLEEPSHQEFVTGAADDQPITEASQHLEWFQQQKKPLTPDHDWNKTLPATHVNIQPWISELAKQADSHFSFNELMDTPVDFSTFLMNRLKVDTLTLELLATPTYELMKGHARVSWSSNSF
nr:reverse transcriptase domain-containing protein [Tanacetum cinerariifolium]